MKFTPNPSFIFQNGKKLNFLMMKKISLQKNNENKKMTCSVSLRTPLRSRFTALRSGHITRDIREMARPAISPNSSSATLQKNFVYP